MWFSICLVFMFFIVLIFFVDMIRFRYSERLIIFLFGCYFMVVFVYVIGFFLDKEVVVCNRFVNMLEVVLIIM